MVEVKYTDWGIGSRVGDVIYLSKDLDNYPEIKDYIFQHEMRHTNKSFSIFDFKNEMRPSFKMFPKILWFCLTHPKTWVDFSPIGYNRDKGLLIDIAMGIYYVIGILLMVGLITIVSYILK